MNNICGINGFGRFGLHFLRFYLLNFKKNNFKIKFINDQNLSFEQIKAIIKNDNYVNLSKYDLKFKKNSIIFFYSKKTNYEIFFTNSKLNKISWLSSINYFLECSGEKIEKTKFITKSHKNIKNLIISATSHNSDKTLIWGFNQNKYLTKYKSISYGSCTVNAFVPLADLINKSYKVKEADVNVIHNIPDYKIKDKKNYKLERKFCTLSASGPKLLNFLNNKNFNVNYTLVPYSGPSIMDIRFNISKKPKNINSVILNIKKNLKNLYGFDKQDKNSNLYKFIENNLRIIISNSSLKNNIINLSGYFDNENSVVRFNDIINHIISVNNNAKKM